MNVLFHGFDSLLRVTTDDVFEQLLVVMRDSRQHPQLAGFCHVLSGAVMERAKDMLQDLMTGDFADVFVEFGIELPEGHSISGSSDLAHLLDQFSEIFNIRG